MELTMTQEKVTKNAVRFGDGKADHPHNIYLTKDEVKELGDPQVITVDIQKKEQ